MSKVIKATHLVFSFPRTVALSQKREDPEKEGLAVNTQDIIAEAEQTIEELFLEAKKKREEMITGANQEAEGIINKAYAEAEELRKQARQEGFEAGYQEIQKKLAHEQKMLEKAAAEMKMSFQEERQHWFRELEPKIIKLAVSIARKIIHTELDLEPGKIEAIVKAVLERAIAQEEVTIKISEDDYPNLEKLTQESLSGSKIRVVIDDTLAKGDCYSTSSCGILDGRIEKQLEAVSSELLEVGGNG